MGNYKYNFIETDECNMCGSGKEFHKILGRRLNRSHGKNPRAVVGIATTIMRCRKCGLVFSNPQPVPDSIEQHYGTDAKDYWKSSYFDNDPNYFQPQISQLKKLKTIIPGMKSLDIGAGIGKAMLALQDAGFEAYGFEPSLSFYKIAFEKNKIESSRLQHASIENAVYAEDYFDFISFGAVLEHLQNPSESIKQALTWLKPGGLIHIEVPSSRWLVNRMANIYYALTGTDYVANISPMHKPFHLFEFDLRSFGMNSKINNYDVAFYRYWNGVTHLPKILNPLLFNIMTMTSTGKQLEVWLKK